jgi:DNA-binding XRE family transcriptional regulator
MGNPVIEARQALGLSRMELAEATNLAHSTVEYIEKGAYGSLPRSITQCLKHINPTLKQDYDLWKIQARLGCRSFEAIRLPVEFPSLSDVMHPHIEFRVHFVELSLNVYCEELCIPRHIVQNFEAHRQRRFPKELSNALLMVMGSEQMGKLIRGCDTYGKNTPASHTSGV